MTIAHGAPYTHSRASVLPSVLFMNSIVLSALLPVTALIAFGFLLGRTRWLGPRMVKHLSDLAFLVLTPILLFRTMGKVHVEQLDLKPAAAYILALALVFAGMLVLRGLSRTSAVLALAAGSDRNFAAKHPKGAPKARRIWALTPKTPGPESVPAFDLIPHAVWLGRAAQRQADQGRHLFEPQASLCLTPLEASTAGCP